MKEKDVERAKEAMSRFDPRLVSIAMGEMDVRPEDVERAKETIGKAYESIETEESQQKMQVFSKAVSEVGRDVLAREVENIKAVLGDFDRDLVIAAGKDLGVVITNLLCVNEIPCSGGRCVQLMMDPGKLKCLDYIKCTGTCIQLMHVADTKYCFDPIGECGFCIQIMHVTADTKLCFDPIGECGLCIQVMNVLDRIDPGGVVVTDGRVAGVIIVDGRVVNPTAFDSKVAGGIMVDMMDGGIITNLRVGPVGKCFDSVVCTGPQIYVMSKCFSNLVTLDIGGTVSPIDAVLKVAETHPAMHKRVTKMIGKMKEAGEL
jgi:hypothetical protein